MLTAPVRRTSLVIAVVGLIVVHLASQTWAASQAGGVPDLASQVATLQATVATLQTNLNTLQTNLVTLQTTVTTQQTTITTLQTTITTLQNTNTGLQSALNAEIAARTAGDAALQTALNQEIVTRTNGDFSLGVQIANEQFVREQGDFNLQNEITNLQNVVSADPVGTVFSGAGGLTPPLTNDHPTVVASVNVPAGSYLVHAVVPIVNSDNDNQFGACALSTAGPDPFGGEGNGAVGFINLPTFPDEFYQMPLIGTAKFTADATITVSCIGFRWQAGATTIEALRIHDLP